MVRLDYLKFDFLEFDRVRYCVRGMGRPSCWEPGPSRFGPRDRRTEFQARYLRCWGSVQNGAMDSFNCMNTGPRTRGYLPSLNITRITWDFILEGCRPISWHKQFKVLSLLFRPLWLITALKNHVNADCSLSLLISATVVPGPGAGPGHTRAPWLMRTRVSSALSSRYVTLKESKLLPCTFT